MKSYLPLFMAILSSSAHAGYSATLTTPSYVVEIQVRCEEGAVSCDDVSYQGINRKTGKRLDLKGKTLHSMCADGITPCRFIGYAFRNKNFTYQVDDDGHLLVMQGKKVLVDEQGEWD